jgi:hypothetical protein
MTNRLYFIVDAYVKSRENPENHLKKLIYVSIVLFASIVISWLFQKQIWKIQMYRIVCTLWKHITCLRDLNGGVMVNVAAWSVVYYGF